MKKKLVSLLVAGAMVAPVVVSAQVLNGVGGPGTHVTIFGRVQAEYSTIDIDGKNAQTGILDDANQSRWGLHVSENLGMGLRAMGRIEYGLNPGSGRNDNAREQWVGLGGDQWGELKFGRVQSPFKDFAGGHTIDPFAYTTLHANGSGGTMTASANGMGSGDNSFVNSSARFDSAKVEGFSMSALLMPGDANRLNPQSFGGVGGYDPLNPNMGGEDGEWDFQVAGKYSNKFLDAHGLDIFGGYSRDNISDRQKAANPNADDEEIWRGGGKYSFGDFSLRGQYEYVNNANPFGGAASCSQAAALGAYNLNTPNLTGDGGRGQCLSAMHANGDGYLWFAGADYTIGNTMLVAQGGMAHSKSIGALDKRDVESLTVGVIHSLSRRSSLFGGYQRAWVADRNTTTTDSDRNVYTVGMRHDF